MKNVSLRNEFEWSNFILCPGEIQCFGNHHRIMSFLWFAHRLFRMLQRTLDPKCAIPCLIRRTLRWMPVITGIPFWTIGEACWLVLLSHSPKIPSWRAGRSRTLTFSFGFSLLLWIVFHSTLNSSRALTFCCQLYAISTVSFSFAL